MGTYLSTNLWFEVNISRKAIQNNGLDNEGLINFLKSEIDFQPDIYELENNEESFTFRLKSSLIEQELLPFLEAYYAVYYSNPQTDRSTSLLNHLRLISPNQWAEYLSQDDADPIYTERDSYDLGNYRESLYVSVKYWRLTFEGKVMAEEMGAHLNLFTYALKRAFANFKIAHALDVTLLG